MLLPISLKRSGANSLYCLWLILAVCLDLCTASMANAIDISELMEKAIYTEESVGNLEEAIRVYEQVVAEGQAIDEVAAQAQFRIGDCYAKQGKEVEAQAAFQSVIDNYPKAKELVARAKKRLPNNTKLLPAPWGEGDEMVYEMYLPTGMGIGHQVFRVNKLDLNGSAVWECNAWQTVTINGMAGKSRVEANYETFAPIKSRWKHSLLGDSKGVYKKNEVSIQMLNKEKPVTVKFDGLAYDNEQAAEMFRRLPLKVGYKETIDVIPILTATKLPLGIEVPKMETIEVPFGKFECFVLKLNIGQTFWISNDKHRYIVRFEAGGVTANLVEAYPYLPNRKKKYQSEEFTIVLPPNWYIYSATNPENRGYFQRVLIDPKASMYSYINSRPIERIKDKCKTVEAWAEESINKHKREKSGFQLSDEGIQAITFGGHKACQVVFNSHQGDKSKKERMILCYGDKFAVNLRFAMAADEYDKNQLMIDQLLSTLIVN